VDAMSISNTLRCALRSCRLAHSAGEADIAWAENDRADLGGWRKGDVQLDLSGLETMQTLEFHISQFTPKTVMTARAMLEMAIEILAYQNINPDHQFASGPVLEIVRGCLHGLKN
jgi:hypothetical protein